MSRKSRLSEDDIALWQQIADTIHPLRRRKPDRVTPSDSIAGPASAAASPAPPPTPDAVDSTPAGKRRWQPLVTTPAPKPAAPPPPALSIDRRHAKKIARGHITIDGRIDLHGLREAEAHIRLRGFLRQAQAQGKRIVLVITGKGRDDDDPSSPYDFGMGQSRRGVLKRNVPRWLAEPDLAPLVVSFGPAHTRHGGDGALYVHIRQYR